MAIHTKIMKNVAILINICSGLNKVRIGRLLALGLLVGVLGACATVNSNLATVKDTVKDTFTDDVSPDDPIEPVNRVIYKFNDTFDRYLLQPVAQGYTNVVPLPLRNCVRNVFSNVADIPAAFNNTLQAKLGSAVSDAGRFVVNSTVGILGCFDVASEMGIEKHKEDFGQTLGYWGVPSGPYLMLPFLGPSTLRDAAATFTVDARTNAIYYIDPVKSRNQTYVLNAVDSRASSLDARSFLEGAALDPYVFLREAYLGRRRNMISDGQTSSFAQDEERDQVVQQPTASMDIPASAGTTANASDSKDKETTSSQSESNSSAYLKVGGNER